MPKRLALASLLALSTVVGCGSTREETGASEDFATADIDSMFKRPDGRFDVRCTDGTTATVTVEQLRADAVCGGPASPTTTPPPPPSPPPPAATGAMSLDLAFGAKTGKMSRAQFGFVQPEAAGEELSLHIETHEGGAPACPDQSSPSPDRTLLVTGVKRAAAAGTKLTNDDGVGATFLDFKGELFDGAPAIRATAVTITVVAITDASVELEIDASFGEAGTAKGRLFATHCASLD